MVSAVDTAQSEGMEPRASGLIFGAAWPFKTYDLHREESFAALMERWVPLTIALNNMSRGMGHNDFYPFVIPAPALGKLAFVHHAIRDYVAAHSTVGQAPKPATAPAPTNAVPPPATQPADKRPTPRTLVGRVFDRLK
jgi:hypothetical protein